jgi:hypothetical protein
MIPPERAHVWQQHINDWQTSGVSGTGQRLLQVTITRVMVISGVWKQVEEVAYPVG